MIGAVSLTYDMQRVNESKRKLHMDTKIIFIGNYKGGVGKTTSVLNFAEYFLKRIKGFWRWTLIHKVH